MSVWNWTQLVNMVGGGQWLGLVSYVYTNLLGDFFYLFLEVMILIPLYLKTRSVLVPSVILTIFSGILIPLLPPEAVRFAYLSLVLGVAGSVYALLRGY